VEQVLEIVASARFEQDPLTAKDPVAPKNNLVHVTHLGVIKWWLARAIWRSLASWRALMVSVRAILERQV
jgi:hypothetical protein